MPPWVLRCAADRAVLLRDAAGTELNDGGIGAGADGWSAVTADVRYADHWTEGRSLSVTTWIDPDEARRRHETGDGAFTALFWAEGVPRDRRPILAANVARGHGVRVVFLDERGSRTRAIDYDWREGRLWRWIDTLFSYPDDARRYRMDQAVEVTAALFEPNGDGRVEIRDKVASSRDMDVLTVEDAPVQGFWLDRPPFGEWEDLLNPLYGVPGRRGDVEP